MGCGNLEEARIDVFSRNSVGKGAHGHVRILSPVYFSGSIGGRRIFASDGGEQFDLRPSQSLLAFYRRVRADWRRRRRVPTTLSGVSRASRISPVEIF